MVVFIISLITARGFRRIDSSAPKQQADYTEISSLAIARDKIPVLVSRQPIVKLTTHYGCFHELFINLPDTRIL